MLSLLHRLRGVSIVLTSCRRRRKRREARPVPHESPPAEPGFTMIKLCYGFVYAVTLSGMVRAPAVPNRVFAHDQQRGDGTVPQARLGRSSHVWYGVCKDVFRESSATSRRRPGYRPTAVPGGARRTPERRT
jgi:hypothetical protein